MCATTGENQGKNEGSAAPNASCRICRGDGSHDNPLFHPCKCRGSIKYIHEDCLLEWVASKNVDLTRPGADIKCDICHYTIQFKTMYDKNMPGRIPFGLVIRTTVKSAFHKVRSALCISLAAILLVIGIPLAWNAIGKVIAMILFGGTLPVAHDFWKSLLYGYEQDVPTTCSDLDIALQVLKNYRFSLTQIAFVAVIHIALYFQYDMVVREPIFGKMIFHKIGPRFNKEELMTEKLKQQFPAMDENTINHILQLMNAREERIHAQQQQQQQQEEVQQPDPQQQAHNPENDTNNDDQHTESQNINNLVDGDDDENDNDYNPNDTLATDDDSDASLDSSDHEIDNEEREQLLEQPDPMEAIMRRRAVNEFDNLLQAGQENQNGEQPEEPRVIAVGNDAAANPEEAWNQQEGAAILGLHLRFRNIPFYFLATTAFLAVYLYLTYAVPTFLGNLLMTAYSRAILYCLRGLVKMARVLKVNHYWSEIARRFPLSHAYASWLQRHYGSLVSYIYSLHSNYIDYQNKASTIAQSLPALTTYCTLLSLICASTDLISRGYGPKSGMKNPNLRFVFQLFFAIRCSLKVFLLFGIELVGFPVLAGVMIDLSLISPCLQSHEKLLFVGSLNVWSPSIWLIYWTIGTFYMFWFAKYVAMVRKYIIRPGVLFFIRSSDDPNIRILHDSLIHPMRIQVSRLLLSMMIYALFIIVGFGFHTRVLFPLILKSNVLPFDSFHAVEILFVLTLHPPHRITGANKGFKMYVRQYWTKVFNVSCRKLRLSSFMLDHDVLTERGYIKYRSAFHKFLIPKKAKWSNPDLYVDPKTPAQAEELFRAQKNVHAYFIPNGTLMRVPANDIISRNYVQTLFVPVTKENKLLKPLDVSAIKERNKDNVGEYSHLDDQSTEFDAYTVVYTPPNFRARYSVLIALIWAFASILCIGLAFVCNALGKITLLTCLSPLSNFEATRNAFTGYRNLRTASLLPMALGAAITMRVIDAYQKFALTRAIQDDHVVHNDDQGDVPANEAEAEPVGAERIAEDLNIANQDNAQVFWNRMLWHERFLPTLVGLIKGAKYGIVLEYNYYFISVLMDVFLKPKAESDTPGLWLIATSWSELKSISYGKTAGLSIFMIWFLSALLMDERRFLSALMQERPADKLKLMKSLLIDLNKECLLTAGLSVLLQFAVCAGEYFSNSSSYSSFSSVLNFLWKSRLLTPSTKIAWVTFQGVFYLIPPTLCAIFYLPRLARIISVSVQAAIANTKEEVYGRGKTLTNLPDGDDR